MLAADVLSDAGFTVLESTNAEEALRLLETRSDVQVLFTDGGALAGGATGREGRLTSRMRLLLTFTASDYVQHQALGFLRRCYKSPEPR
jgi:hypothetical protein